MRGRTRRIIDAVFSTTEYHTDRSIVRGILFLRTKTDAELSAMTPPPPSPFTVDVTVTMTNDEDQTASGTITFETTYDVIDTSGPAIGEAAPGQ